MSALAVDVVDAVWLLWLLLFWAMPILVERAKVWAHLRNLNRRLHGRRLAWGEDRDDES